MKGEAHVTKEHQQPEILRKRLNREGVTHGQEGKIDVAGVRVGPIGVGVGPMNLSRLYLCEVVVCQRETTKEGNGTSIQEVPVHLVGFEKLLEMAGEEEAYFALGGLKCENNGIVLLAVDEETELSMELIPAIPAG